MGKSKLGFGLDIVGWAVMTLMPNQQMLAWIALIIGSLLILWDFIPWAKSQTGRGWIYPFLAGMGALLPICVLLSNIYLKANYGKPKNTTLVNIYDGKYENQIINLDGKRFVRCKFKNINFMWEGGTFEFSEDKPEYFENVCVSSTVPLVTKTMILFAKTKMLNELAANSIMENRVGIPIEKEIKMNTT